MTVAAPRRVDVAIIGTGFSGIGAAIGLLAEGVTDLVLLEQADAIGGTWRDNTYPGAACDVASHLYSFSFAPNASWSRRFAPQPEIRAYLEGIVDAHDLRRRVIFGATVTEARFDAGRWTLRCVDGRAIDARFVIFGVGALRDPKWPDIPGQDTFSGPSMHSARWRHDVALAGKRVGVIGSAASAIQVVPAIAPEVSALTVFQRTPSWVNRRRDAPISDWRRRLYLRAPWLMRLERAKLYASFEFSFPLVFRAGPLGRRFVRSVLTRRIRRAVAGHPVASTVVPDYDVGCKRVLLSDEWYPTLQRDTVSVETRAIEAVVPEGVRLADGEVVPLDVIVYCTGFRVDDPLGGMSVTGLCGRDLRGYWGQRPRAHLGMTVPGFPNAFLLLGPNTALGHSSVVIMIEAQIGYIRQAICFARARGPAWLDVREDALAAFVAEVDAAHDKLVWSSGCSSWYLTAAGENFTVWPGTTLSYRSRVRHFDPTCFHLGGYS